MKIFLLILFPLLLAVPQGVAQTTEQQRPNAISLEVGKTGLIYNLTFERQLLTQPFGFRVGVGSNLSKRRPVFTTGAGGYYLVGTTRRFLELGIDLHYLRASVTDDDVVDFASLFSYPDFAITTLYPSLNIGYRGYRKHTLFRVGVSSGIISGKFIPGGYISYGFRF